MSAGHHGAAPVLLVSGREFARRGARGVASVMEELIKGARHELHILAYVIAPSARHVVALLDGALASGVRVNLVLNVIAGEPVALGAELLDLAARYPHASIRFFSDPAPLHAKVLVADRERAVIGSANYTWSGLSSNHEIGVLLSGAAAYDVASLVDRLSLSSSAHHAPP